ncbi:STM4013/SEN3800 family hydrolase [Nocardiopsis ansamitocini]|uniref:Membrane protein n=1 Tax=Nocardiopsis ansamitocini TaxID=1670832 RepID=A0A9W6P3S9_9ACTN|nr:STM4013/SEN3800 family hydrolase [Nocardiopsis ansamitocini]GLU46508.1 membrane protein [Nocardiopsis ansamitocini]
MTARPDMNTVVGTHDIILVTLDTLRYDVAARLLAEGRTPNLGALLPDGSWERRHAPASFTYASHLAMLAGFLPTPAEPGPHPRLFAAGFPGSTTTDARTWTFDAPDIVAGLAATGYHTACVGGTGFFNRLSALGSVLPDLFTESHWEPEFGVTDPASFENQVARVAAVTRAAPDDRPLFLLLNVSALHQPNWFYLRGARPGTPDGPDSHAAALEYVDAHVPALLAALRGRGRPCFTIVCADHGTAYGEDGHTGHRIGHETVWTVPYAQFTIPAARPEEHS